jgi:hypothetical protein
MSNAIEGINALGERERARAYQIARARIAGDEPQLEDFARKTYSKYPPEHTQRMKRLGYGLLVPAFFGSAIRIFLAAFETNAIYLTGTQHPTLEFSVPLFVAILVGLTSVLLAETGQVAFTLWASSVPEEATAMRVSLTLGAWACMAFALAANFYIVNPLHAWPDIGACVLALIETVLPPFVVLIAANVLKSLSLHDIENRHAAKTDYETQHAAWLARIGNAQQDASWMQIVANELRDAIRNANRRSFAKLRALNNEDWRVLVMRELNADNWYAQSVPAESSRIETPAPEDTQPPVEKPKPVPRVRAATAVGTSNSNGKHTDEFANAVHANADGTFVGICPHCGKSTNVKDNARSAMAALIAHKRGCVALRDPSSVSVPVVQAAEAFINEVGNEEG